MPCLSISFDPKVGPLINLGFGLPATTKGADSANPARVNLYGALIDTGASMTCIAREIAVETKLPLIGKTQMASASHVVEANVYLADLVLPFGRPGPDVTSFLQENVQVMEFEPNRSPFKALLGRDVLCAGVFSMVGFDGKFTFCL
jgi:hypothetical protein